jgi:hypothetical protein
MNAMSEHEGSGQNREPAHRLKKLDVQKSDVDVLQPTQAYYNLLKPNLSNLIPFACRFRFVRLKSLAAAQNGMRGQAIKTNRRMKMTKSIRTWLVAGTMAALLAGCIPSVNPFYTAKDLRFDPQLLGEWHQEGEKPESWKFDKAGEQGYKLTITEKENKQGNCTAFLFKLKDELFLDIIPNDCNFADGQAELVAAAMFPGHLLLRVSQSGSQLSLALLNYEWLEKHLKAHPSALAHHREGERVLLTAGTRDLQRFVLRHLGEGELFGETTQYRRR